MITNSFGELLGDVFENRENLFLLAQVDHQPLFLDGDGGKSGHALADLQLRISIQAAVLLVDDLQAADHIMQIVQRYTDHGLGRKAVVVEDRPVKARIAGSVFHHDRFSRFGNQTLDPEAVFHGDVGDIDRPDMEHGTESVGLRIQKPDRPRFTVERLDNNLQTPGQCVLEAVHLQKLLHDLPCRFGKLFFFRHAR